MMICAMKENRSALSQRAARLMFVCAAVLGFGGTLESPHSLFCELLREGEYRDG